jgi:hypothetical protein
VARLHYGYHSMYNTNWGCFADYAACHYGRAVRARRAGLSAPLPNLLQVRTLPSDPPPIAQLDSRYLWVVVHVRWGDVKPVEDTRAVRVPASADAPARPANANLRTETTAEQLSTERRSRARPAVAESRIRVALRRRGRRRLTSANTNANAAAESTAVRSANVQPLERVHATPTEKPRWLGARARRAQQRTGRPPSAHSPEWLLEGEAEANRGITFDQRTVSPLTAALLVDWVLSVVDGAVPVRVALMAEGERDEFASLFFTRHPDALFLQGTPHTLTRDLAVLAQAHILIMGHSSFGVLGAALNPNAIIIADATYKWQNWAAYRPQQLLSYRDAHLPSGTLRRYLHQRHFFQVPSNRTHRSVVHSLVHSLALQVV